MASRCFWTAWIVAWAVAVFAPSLVIAYLGLSDAAAALGTGLHRLPASTWKVADDVGPAVKLTMGGLLLVAFLGLDRLQVSPIARTVVSISLGIAAVAITIAFIPTTFSRGFAVALTVTRFDPLLTAIYCAGGALAGVSFVFGFDRCSRTAATSSPG